MKTLIKQLNDSPSDSGQDLTPNLFHNPPTREIIPSYISMRPSSNTFSSLTILQVKTSSPKKTIY